MHSGLNNKQRSKKTLFNRESEVYPFRLATGGTDFATSALFTASENCVRKTALKPIRVTAKPSDELNGPAVTD